MSWYICLITTIVLNIAVCPVRTQTPWKVEYALNYELKFFNKAGLNFNKAKDLCKKNNGIVVRMDVAKVRDKVYQIIPRATVKFFWIGATGTLRNWTWLEETSPANTDFITWYEHQPDNSGKKENNLIIRKSDLKYGDIGKEFKNAGTICQQTIVHGVKIFQGFRLEILQSEFSFQQAQTICQERGGTLFEPRTERRNNALKTIMNSPKGYYIGLKYSARWEWISDNQTLSYANWTSGHPSNGSKCALIRSPSGQWENVNCINPRRNLACQKHIFCNSDGTSNSCQNGGTCSQLDAKPYYNCKCMQGYYGVNCSEQHCEAHINPCKNGGTCLSLVTGTLISCHCRSGYYGVICQEFLRISNPGTTITVVGDKILRIEITVETTRKVVTLSFYKTSNWNNPIQKLEKITNGTVNFGLRNINKENGGNYRVFAKVSHPSYAVHTDFVVIIHENATIKNVNPRFTYSPKTTELNQIACHATGTPRPVVSWYRAGLLVRKEESHKGVFQTMINSNGNERIAYLNVTNAELSNNGTYLCKADNTVGSDKRNIIAKALANLAVYGAPIIQKVSSIPCSISGTIDVKWQPNNQTNRIKHRFSLRSMGIPHNVSSTTMKKQVRFDKLLPFTTYQIQISVCPEDCILKLNATTTIKTGVGLPGEVYNPALLRDNDLSTCIVSWNWSKTTPSDLISHTEVTWKSYMAYSADNNSTHKAMEITSTNISSQILLSNISTLPNRRYFVSLRAFTCAGPGAELVASGSCQTDPEAPTLVEESSVSSINNRTLRKIDVVLPDENNGRISCVFIIVSEGNLSESHKFLFNEKTLWNSSFASQGEKPTNSTYISLAIQRQNFTGSTYPTVLGDNRTSFCDPAEASITSIQSKTSARTGGSNFWAKNWPLRDDGTIYSYYTVTTTPTSSGHIHFGRSKAHTFQNGEKGSLTLTLVLIFVGVAVVVICIAGASWRYRERVRGKRDVSNSENPEENTYANLVLNELSSGTTIALSKLHNIYKAMKVNNSLQFREEFQELKLQAKVVALPSTIGESEEMMVKNRYKNIIPYDSTIAKLQGEGIDGYINACHIKGKWKNFIAAQGPLSNTIADFWRMVLEYNMKVIVMLTRCAEGGKRKCEKYWPDLGETKEHGYLKVQNVEEQSFGGYVRRTLKIITIQEVQHEVVQFQFVNWPDHGVPTTTSNFFRFHKAVMEIVEQEADRPLLTHCSAGVGRTGTFIGFDILLHESKQKKSIDVFSCVLEMRRQRVEMVQTSAQYELLHKLLLENYMFGDSDISTDDLEKMELNNSSSSAHKRIEKEFQNLPVADSLNAHKDECQSSPSHQNFGQVIITRQPEDTEWICFDASHVEAFDGCTDLIAAQGPVKSTLEYFWRAVLDNKVGIIVMLNNIEEGSEDQQTCAVQYWPESTLKPLELNDVTIQMLDEHTSSGICAREFLVLRKDQSQKKIKHYQNLAWASSDVPENIGEILSLVSKLQTGSEEKPGAILIHCSDGLGKTGAFCAILNVIARINAEKRIDVFRAVKDLRDCRPGLVRTLEEYVLCYKTAQAYLETVNVYTDVSLIDDDTQIYQNIR